MKRINIHHFPQNPFQEQPHHRHHSHHHHHHHRRYSFAHSHYGSMHNSHHRHHGLLTSFTNRTLKTSFDLARLSLVREQLNLPTSATRENIESNVPLTTDDQSPASTPLPIAAARSDSFSLSNNDDQIVTNFLTHYLGRDGILVIYILQRNTNEVITGEIVTALFELFKTNYRTNTVE